MEEKRELGLDELLMMVIRDLSRIQVPVMYTESIAVPISKSIANLHAGLKFINELDRKEEKADEENGAVCIEIENKPERRPSDADSERSADDR